METQDNTTAAEQSKLRFQPLFMEGEKERLFAKESNHQGHCMETILLLPLALTRFISTLSKMMTKNVFFSVINISVFVLMSCYHQCLDL